MPGVDPNGILGGSGVQGEHLGRLREHVFEASGADTTVEFASFRREALLGEELRRVRQLVAEFRGILSAAESRRKSNGSLVTANAFVGVCLAEIREPTLPDLPLEVF